MEGDHRVWPPRTGPRHRRTPPEDGELAWGRDEEPRRERASPFEQVREPEPPPEPWPAPPPEFLGRRDVPHPLDLEPEEPWNPRIQRTADRGLDPPDDPLPDWESLPPSARLYGSPADPGLRRRVGGRAWRRWAGVLVALLAGTGLVAGATAVVLRLTEPPAETGKLSDSLAGVTVTLPQGWREGAVAPVTGFTSVIRDGGGGLVMARPVPGPVENAKKATAEAAELYSRLLLKGDRVTIVEDRQLPEGHTRALRAEYQDVVNRPAFLRVMLLTRDDKAVLLVGLLQPEETSRRQALDAVMTSIR
ncbi:hypothetical protein ACFLIM_07070 [Nonomuraea sp. M3C6]|uniref:DUF1795 domain-containing protein n=1 Tax=Nonomuraea marmarensis TaxID=3351344 RepID=A0ABW7A9B8_9ACTN